MGGIPCDAAAVALIRAFLRTGQLTGAFCVWETMGRNGQWARVSSFSQLLEELDEAAPNVELIDGQNHSTRISQWAGFNDAE